MKCILSTWLFLSIFALAGLPGTAFAWGPEGHEIVADVADHYLTPVAKAQLKTILGGKKLDDFEICSWPDIIRGDKEYEAIYPGNGHWHYIDFDAGQYYDDDFELKPPADDQDVVDQILRFHKVLAAADTTPEKRLDALRFLTHFVGDIHQPLHCAYRYFDMGGNMIPVHSFTGQNFAFDADTPMDYAPNLHAMWDEYLVEELLGTTRPRTYAKQLVKEITPKQIHYWSNDEVLKWAVDTYWKARKEAYRWTDGTKLPYKWAHPGMDITSENYIDSHLSLVKEQLEKAGVRLAYMLNTALDPDYVPPPAPAVDGLTPELSPHTH